MAALASTKRRSGVVVHADGTIELRGTLCDRVLATCRAHNVTPDQFLELALRKWIDRQKTESAEGVQP